MALVCETQPRRFSSPHDTQSTVLSKAKLPPQLGKQPLRLIKIGLVLAGVERFHHSSLSSLQVAEAGPKVLRVLHPLAQRLNQLSEKKTSRIVGKGSGQACPRGGRRRLAMGTEVPGA